MSSMPQFDTATLATSSNNLNLLLRSTVIIAMIIVLDPAVAVAATVSTIPCDTSSTSSQIVHVTSSEASWVLTDCNNNLQTPTSIQFRFGSGLENMTFTVNITRSFLGNITIENPNTTTTTTSGSSSHGGGIFTITDSLWIPPQSGTAIFYRDLNTSDIIAHRWFITNTTVNLALNASLLVVPQTSLYSMRSFQFLVSGSRVSGSGYVPMISVGSNLTTQSSVSMLDTNLTWTLSTLPVSVNASWLWSACTQPDGLWSIQRSNINITTIADAIPEGVVVTTDSSSFTVLSLPSWSCGSGSSSSGSGVGGGLTVDANAITIGGPTAAQVTIVGVGMMPAAESGALLRVASNRLSAHDMDWLYVAMFSEYVAMVEGDEDDDSSSAEPPPLAASEHRRRQAAAQAATTTAAPAMNAQQQQRVSATLSSGSNNAATTLNCTALVASHNIAVFENISQLEFYTLAGMVSLVGTSLVLAQQPQQQEELAPYCWQLDAMNNSLRAEQNISHVSYLTVSSVTLNHSAHQTSNDDNNQPSSTPQQHNNQSVVGIRICGNVFQTSAQTVSGGVVGQIQIDTLPTTTTINVSDNAMLSSLPTAITSSSSLYNNGRSVSVMGQLAITNAATVQAMFASNTIRTTTSAMAAVVHAASSSSSSSWGSVMGQIYITSVGTGGGSSGSGDSTTTSTSAPPSVVDFLGTSREDNSTWDVVYLNASFVGNSISVEDFGDISASVVSSVAVFCETGASSSATTCLQANV